MDSSLAADYARYGSLLLRLAIKNNENNLLSSNKVAANENVSEALLQSTLPTDGKKRVIELDSIEEDEDEQVDEKAPEGESEEESGPEEQQEGEVQEEEEDDFTIAWETLDLARVLYEKNIAESADEEGKKLNQKQLGFVYFDLGDLSLENGKRKLEN